MNSQPSGDCLGAFVEVTPDPPPVRDAGVPAAWFILAMVLAVAVFEGWAIVHHQNTISHLIQRLAHGHHLFRWAAFCGLVLLTWHLLWGFPG